MHATTQPSAHCSLDTNLFLHKLSEIISLISNTWEGVFKCSVICDDSYVTSIISSTADWLVAAASVIPGKKENKLFYCTNT